MNRVLIATALFWAAVPAAAHRLDEYLQAATISIAQSSVQVDLVLTPGVAVLPQVLSAIDANGDGAVSGPEQLAYVERVLRDISLTLDGKPLPLKFTLRAFPTIPQMQEGLGEIQIALTADLPESLTRDRRIVFENRHLAPISAFLVNALVPTDPNIKVTAQNRNYEQSRYELQFALPQRTKLTTGEGLVAGLLGSLLLARLLMTGTDSRART